MGFLEPTTPDLPSDWDDLPRAERIRPMAADWAVAGFGTPDVVIILYVVKMGLYLLGAAAVTATTPGLGGLGDLGQWWTEPVFWQKAVTFSLLFEILGLGCAFGPLTMRFKPPLGSFLYWLRPGTVRLAPWPDRVPGTGGDRRTALDAALYAGVVASLVWVLAAPGDAAPGAIDATVGLVEPVRFVPLFVLLPLLGLRDKTPFLAARTEVYGTLALMFLFSGPDMIVGTKLVLLLIWWGAATSKLNQHFPHVVAAMMSNSPVLRSKAFKRRFYRSWPDDLRPSPSAVGLAHVGTAVEFVAPLVMLVSFGGDAAIVAAVVMTVFHLVILTSLPMGVPLEWNLFMIFGAWVVFVGHGDVGFGDMNQPLPVLLIVAAAAMIVAAGNLWPGKFSFLPAMPYYAGNWASSLWCWKPTAMEKFEANIVKVSPLPEKQLTDLYGPELSSRMAHKGFAFRAMHTHGRALFGTIPRLAGPNHETDYVLMDGELVAGVTLGWNFGDGHLHDEGLLAALHARCGFEPGEVRFNHHGRMLSVVFGLRDGHPPVAVRPVRVQDLGPAD